MIASLESYVPKGSTLEWKTVRHFVRDAAVLAAQQSSYDAQRLLRTAGPFVVWCTNEQGLPLLPEVIFAPRTIDAYCSQPAMRESTGGTYRSVLLAISKALVPEAHAPTMLPMHKRVIQPPYSAGEMKQFRSWAKGQHTLANRQKAMAMVSFGAGAGLAPSEIGLVMREDIAIDEDGVLITVRGTKARTVPLLRKWERWVLAIANDRSASEPMWGSSTRGNHKNLFAHFVAVAGGEAPSNARLRATWITTHLTLGTPMKELFRASGMTQFTNLHQYLAYVAAADDTEYRKFLRGGAK